LAVRVSTLGVVLLDMALYLESCVCVGTVIVVAMSCHMASRSSFSICSE
jgi:hypothetical protein